MRLENVESGHVCGTSSCCRSSLFGGGAPDVVKLLLYRPSTFGEPFSQLVQVLLRGPSSWTQGERELFAAFTRAHEHLSLLNPDPRRGRVDRAGEQKTAEILADYRKAAIRIACGLRLRSLRR